MMDPGNLMDRGRAELHDADAELRMRQRDVRHLGRQFVAMVLLAVGMLVLLAVLTLAAGKF